MRVMSQIAMVMNLDKCIGCHTCSVTCKNVWTNRPGAEYMWFNNVETKPGVGFPKRYEDQEQWHGGWQLDRRGKLRLRSGSRLRRLLNLFFNPDLPQIDDYYEPWSYDYESLFTAKDRKRIQPAARPKSQLTKGDLSVQWGPNWEDDLAGAPGRAHRDPNLEAIEEQIRLEYEQVFMMYLPRICEHCLNPACVAACPSGAMYKRLEDGIVLVDQEKCRGWRMCVSNCPYKKVYFNHQTGKAEKCTLCFPRLEAGLPTICSETCVGRIRYLGIVLYDADRVEAAASEPDVHRLLDAQLGVFLDPEDPGVRAQATRDGIPSEWLDAARRSPVYALACKYRVALPLHPEYRTLPMVWYVPPLSPVRGGMAGSEGTDAQVFGSIDRLRIPMEYLANLLAAGDTSVIRTVLKKLAAMRGYMRAKELGAPLPFGAIDSLGMSTHDLESLYRLLGIAKYEDRFVIPPAHVERARDLMLEQGSCGLDFSGGPGSCASVNGNGHANGKIIDLTRMNV